MKAYIKTFGCQMNEQDSELMRRALSLKGYVSARSAEEADLILINTCHIREKAYQKGMSEIGRHRDRGARIGVTGCVASVNGKKILSRFPQVDFVLGTDQIHKLSEVVDSVIVNGKRENRTGFQDISDYEFPSPLEGTVEKKVKAYVTIMKGCDNRCAFCVVPQTRGAEVSRLPEEIIREINQLAEAGVREVTLLGQNVNSYGKRLDSKSNFSKLLRLIDEKTEIKRIRFTSPHPKDLSRSLMEEYLHNKKLCPHIHLPVQSGSSRILKRMRRSYTRETYLKRVAALRSLLPEIAITTDIIVGFPGETENDFEATLDLIREVGYDQCYSFEYSERPGTEAAQFPDDVSKDEKKDRLHRLQHLQDQLSLTKNQSKIGSIQEVLVEGPSSADQGQLMGRTPHGTIVNFDGPPRLIGDILRTKIGWASPYSLRGEINAD